MTEMCPRSVRAGFPHALDALDDGVTCATCAPLTKPWAQDLYARLMAGENIFIDMPRQHGRSAMLDQVAAGPPPPTTTLADIEVYVDFDDRSFLLNCMRCGVEHLVPRNLGVVTTVESLLQLANEHLVVCPGPIEEMT